MIDLDKAEKEFIKYSERFNIQDSLLKRKQLHSLRVGDLSRQIAQKMKLSDEEIQIATLIGLLHDIARFEQFTKYGTFRDRESIDHGDLGVAILKKDDYIKTYIEDEKYKDIIYVAIKNHNKYKIEENLTDEELFFSKLIRDADKIDILYECISIFWKGKEESINQSILSNEMYEQFKKQKLIKIEKDRNYNTIDDMLITLAYTFDINFKESYKYIKEQDYINRIMQRFNFKNIETKEKVKELINLLNKYIENESK